MKEELIKQLGRTETVKDVQSAYNAIFKRERLFQIAFQRAKQNEQRIQAELECFLDDLVAITGLPMGSPMFMTIAKLTIALRMARRDMIEDDDDGMKDFPL